MLAYFRFAYGNFELCTNADANLNIHDVINMIEPIIDKSKVIIRPPEMRVCGVVCKDNKTINRYKLFGSIAVVCGVISALGCAWGLFNLGGFLVLI